MVGKDFLHKRGCMAEEIQANVFIRGVAFPRLPCELLRHALRGDFQPVTRKVGPRQRPRLH